MHRSTIHPSRAGSGRSPLAAGAVSLGFLLALGGVAASAPVSIPLPAPFPPIRLLTVLIGLHLLGLCFGLGGATMLYFWILRWLRWGALPVEIRRIFLFVSKVVSVGLGLLWLSGLGFLAIYAVESPEKFDNPKLWAKMVVVLVLTINGLVVHGLMLSSVLRDVDRPLLGEVSRLRSGIVLISGAVSGVSWYTAFALGLMRELNGRVAVEWLLARWLAAILAAALVAFLYWRTRLRGARRVLAAGVARGPAPEMQIPVARGRIPPDQILARVPTKTSGVGPTRLA
ncbi:hypothetical protein [Methylobacterium sp.]|uniref:hypothetical protein n=1 Tax=Methylobacterium sp. TaxID=409 RepID=UPI0025831F16|nr:hypothetical protein [Methylobacterium sp.]